MSRSNPTAKNPAQRFFRWSGGAEPVGKNDEGVMQYEGGKVTYWNKEKEENIEIDLPFTFLVLDELTTLTGYNEATAKGYYSNEVRDMNKQKLTVKTKTGTVASGYYKKLKAMGISGLKFTDSVYIGFYNEENELVIGNIQLSGAAFSAWLEFKKKYDVNADIAVQMSVNENVKTKGKTKYFEPSFAAVRCSKATGQLADDLDIVLQTYLERYFVQRSDDAVVADDYDEDDAEEEDDLHNLDGIDKNADNTLEDGTVVEEDEPAPKKKATKSSDKGVVGDPDIKVGDVEF